MITGGGSGLGRAYCEVMSEYGAEVACVGRTEEKLQETLEIIDKYGHRAIAIKADVSKQEDIKNMVNETVKKLGSVDIVFANACELPKDMVKIHEASVEDWDRIFAIQPRGVFLLMREVFPLMMKKKSGCFISTASSLLLGPVGPGFIKYATSYHTAKAGVIMLTKMAARQYGEYGIRANVICPGYHRTPISRNERSIEEEVLKNSALKRIGLAEDIKGLALWLASDASRHVTGQTFIQDGGQRA